MASALEEYPIRKARCITLYTWLSFLESILLPPRSSKLSCRCGLWISFVALDEDPCLSETMRSVRAPGASEHQRIRCQKQSNLSNRARPATVMFRQSSQEMFVFVSCFYFPSCPREHLFRFDLHQLHAAAQTRIAFDIQNIG